MRGDELKKLREDHGLTQKAMAALLGYQANYLSRLERGDESITPRFEKLARAMLGKKKTQKSS